MWKAKRPRLATVVEDTMNSIRTINLAVCVLLASAVFGWADIITIDGYDTDWATPDTINDDPQDAGSGNEAVDIDENYYEWDYDYRYCAFAFRTYATMPANNFQGTSDYTEILINTDKDSDTGGYRHGQGGFEYYIYYDLDPGSSRVVTLYEWKNSSWQVVSGADVDALRLEPTDFVEFKVAATEIGSPPEFEWGAYYDNDTLPPDDWCPDTVDQRGFTPEPGTMSLFGLGLVAWCRRRAA